MGCNCGKKSTAARYVWTSKDGTQVVRGLNEVQAKSRVNKFGGSYNPQ